MGAGTVRDLKKITVRLSVPPGNTSTRNPRKPLFEMFLTFVLDFKGNYFEPAVSWLRIF